MNALSGEAKENRNELEIVVDILGYLSPGSRHITNILQGANLNWESVGIYVGKMVESGYIVKNPKDGSYSVAPVGFEFLDKMEEVLRKIRENEIFQRDGRDGAEKEWRVIDPGSDAGRKELQAAFVLLSVSSGPKAMRDIMKDVHRGFKTLKPLIVTLRSEGLIGVDPESPRNPHYMLGEKGKKLLGGVNDGELGNFLRVHNTLTERRRLAKSRA